MVLDANGNRLSEGDSVTVIKDLKVKGASGAIKQGTKVKNIRLVEGDHNIDCKVAVSYTHRLGFNLNIPIEAKKTESRLIPNATPASSPNCVGLTLISNSLT